MSAPDGSAGTAADAIRDAEASLVRQNSVVAQVDLQVVTAVLNAHTVHGAGAAALDRLQQEIETAVVSRTDLDTPAGARSFQHYLIDKVRDIRAVVDGTNLDDTSRATLAAALASLYASSDSPVDPDAQGEHHAGSGGFEEFEEFDEPAAAGPAPEGTPPTPSAPASPPALPSWGSGGSAAPLGGGLPGFAGLPDALLGRAGGRAAEPLADLESGRESGLESGRESGPDADAEPESVEKPAPDTAELTVALPDGQTVTAPTPELAAVIRDAIGGTPIPDAFGDQGITIAPPGSSVADPVEPTGLVAGDIGILADRHALALGNGTAVLDGRIQPIADVTGPGFIGWQHPPEPDPPANGQPGPPANGQE